MWSAVSGCLIESLQQIIWSEIPIQSFTVWGVAVVMICLYSEHNYVVQIQISICKPVPPLNIVIQILPLSSSIFFNENLLIFIPARVRKHANSRAYWKGAKQLNKAQNRKFCIVSIFGKETARSGINHSCVYENSECCMNTCMQRAMPTPLFSLLIYHVICSAICGECSQ